MNREIKRKPSQRMKHLRFLKMKGWHNGHLGEANGRFQGPRGRNAVGAVQAEEAPGAGAEGEQ